MRDPNPRGSKSALTQAYTQLGLAHDLQAYTQQLGLARDLQDASAATPLYCYRRLRGGNGRVLTFTIIMAVTARYWANEWTAYRVGAVETPYLPQANQWEWFWSLSLDYLNLVQCVLRHHNMRTNAIQNVNGKTLQQEKKI